ncbi:MAG: M67 family metallopeptidase [Synergistaceae bacterium]|jgi:proteasome lid subunit RPN8/RPN11|nr:M67 family metallopeptidase [Synergistaceae bacterium]
MSGEASPKYAIRLKKSDYADILAHATNSLPNESCGLIAGRTEGGVKIVERVYALSNADESGEHFTIDPREQLAAVKDMRARGVSPLGNFHSHPDTPARPSEEDIRLARDPSASYMILSLAEGAPTLKSFHIEGGAASPEEIVIV